MSVGVIATLPVTASGHPGNLGLYSGLAAAVATTVPTLPATGVDSERHGARGGRSSDRVLRFRFERRGKSQSVGGDAAPRAMAAGRRGSDAVRGARGRTMGGRDGYH